MRPSVRRSIRAASLTLTSSPMAIDMPPILAISLAVSSGESAASVDTRAKLLKLAGLPVSRHSKTQKMRRTFASHLEASGGDATKALLHDDRGTTARHYIDPAVVGAAPAWRSLPDVG